MEFRGIMTKNPFPASACSGMAVSKSAFLVSVDLNPQSFC